MTATATPVSADSVTRCADALREGHTVILPTDTVYGIAAEALNAGAVRTIYEAKGKAEAAPLQLLFSHDGGDIERFAEFTAPARRLVTALGPGGWTIIVPARAGWESPALAGGRTVGVRIPGAPVVWGVVEALGGPLAASSANRHGAPSPTTCAAAITGVGEYCAFALDAGPAPAAIDSTVIDCAGPEVRILREGAIDRQTVARILGVSDIPVLRSVRS